PDAVRGAAGGVPRPRRPHDQPLSEAARACAATPPAVERGRAQRDRDETPRTSAQQPTAFRLAPLAQRPGRAHRVSSRSARSTTGGTHGPGSRPLSEDARSATETKRTEPPHNSPPRFVSLRSLNDRAPTRTPSPRPLSEDAR